MKKMNKYIINRHHRNLYWKRVRAKEHPFRTLNPYFMGIVSKRTHEEQVKNNFKWITTQARAMEHGHHEGFFHSPSGYRRLLNKERKARERIIMARIRQGQYDLDFPNWKKDADFYFF